MEKKESFEMVYMVKVFNHNTFEIFYHQVIYCIREDAVKMEKHFKSLGHDAITENIQIV